jgi:hypothetical protein
LTEIFYHFGLTREASEKTDLLMTVAESQAKREADTKAQVEAQAKKDAEKKKATEERVSALTLYLELHLIFVFKETASEGMGFAVS